MASCTPTKLLGALALIGALLAADAASAQLLEPAPLNTYLTAPRRVGPMAGRIPDGMVVQSHDEQRGVPNMIVGRRLVRAAGRTPSQIAASHLLALAPSYGLGPASLGTVEEQQVRELPGGGHLVVYRQRIDDVEIFDARLTLVMDRSGALIAAGGSLHGVVASYEFTRSDTDAVLGALADYFRANGPGDNSLLEAPETGRDGTLRYPLSPAAALRGYRVDRPVRVDRVLFPHPERLVPAHYVEVWSSGGTNGGPLWAYVISAEDGAILMRRGLTDHDVYRYRAFVESAAPFQPIDSPFGDTTPDPAGMVVSGVPAYIAPNDVDVEGLNTNPMGLGDPWLPSAATETIGNNVTAYADIVAPDGFGAGDQRGQSSAAGQFLWTYDPMVDPSSDAGQRNAAITNLFFLNNWLHDYFYDAGFDEAAGNAQEDNFGRGGQEGDRIRAESMDNSGRNNANMSTPRDGSNPRMQMYLWNGFRSSAVEQGGSSYDTVTASFGPTNFDVTADMRVVTDGTAPAEDGCETITNDLTGRIALIDRGNCSFVLKVTNATAAGAVGVIVMNNMATAPTSLGGTLDTMTPAVLVSQADGAILRAASGNARMFRVSRPDAPSSMDSQVVAHEWGHYLHRRLISFGEVQGRAMSEGWADWVALFTMMNTADDLTGAYPAASFSGQANNPVYFGIRRVPYSPSRVFNDMSFRHISRGEPLPTTAPLGSGPADNAQVHNAGEIWATMMFDALVKMLEWTFSPTSTYSFEEARERMASYVVTGMQLAPSDATYTEMRDGIIAAALATDPEDARRIALAFAGRGAGSCAVAPPRDSTDLVGVVEDFGVAPVPTIESIDVDAMGAGRLCDGDDVLDSGEEGFVRVGLRNDGITSLAGAELTVVADDPAVTFPAGGTVSIPTLPPGMRTDVWVPVAIADPATVAGPVTFTADVAGLGLCEGVTRDQRVAIDRDTILRDTEDFEIQPPWFAEVSLDGATTGVWTVQAGTLGDPDWVLRGINTVGVTDTAVELPPMDVSPTAPLVLTFEHRFDFEADATTFWDGGVIEYSTDAGMTWTDVDTLVTPGYSGALTDRASNPLSLRNAYSGTNPSFPGADTVSLDFGTALASQTVRFRFRIGTDEATSAPGWEIDDLRVTGTVGPLPFPGYGADGSVCADAPTADAGPDQTVTEGDLVTLDGSASSDPNMDPLTYGWSVVGDGFGLSLSDPSVVMPTFTAPTVSEDTVLRLRLLVSDGTGSDSDEVQITVLDMMEPEVDAGPMEDPDAGPEPMMDPDAGVPPVMDPDAGEPMADTDAGMEEPPMDDGCSCSSVGAPNRSRAPYALALLGLGLVLAARRRRRA